jgi:hypothetical protein
VACGAAIVEPPVPAGDAPAATAVAPPPALAACPACGAEQPAWHRFCTVCGSGLAPLPEPDPVPAPWVRPGAPHPVRVHIRRAPRQGRPGALVRVLGAPAAVLAALAWWLAAVPAALTAWIARLATGRSPAPLRRFLLAWLRFATRANCYAFMVAPGFPGSAAAHAVAVDVPAPDGRPWLRPVGVLAAVPVAVLQWLVAALCAPVAWVAVLATGRIPDGLADVMEQPQRYRARFWAYAFVLTDTFPWFQPEAVPAAPSDSVTA